MSSGRFVDVFGIEAFRRFGVRDPLFEDELRTERDNVVRSSSTRAKERFLKLSQESRGEKEAQAQLEQLIAWWRRLVRQRFERIGE